MARGQKKMSRSGVGKQAEREKRKIGAPMRRLAEMLELPKEIVFNLPIIQAIGNEDISITNYKGLIEYNEGCVRINAGQGVIKLEGVRLVLRHITSETVSVSGRIKKIEFIL